MRDAEALAIHVYIHCKASNKDDETKTAVIVRRPPLIFSRYKNERRTKVSILYIALLREEKAGAAIASALAEVPIRSTHFPPPPHFSVRAADT